MSLFRNPVSLTGLVMALYGCQTEVDFPQLPYDARAIIQGVIEPDSVPIVHFNRTVPYLSGTTDPAKLVIRNAAVDDSARLEKLIILHLIAYIYHWIVSIPISTEER